MGHGHERLREFTDRRGKPHLTGRVGDAVVRVFPLREQFDERSGGIRVWWNPRGAAAVFGARSSS